MEVGLGAGAGAEVEAHTVDCEKDACGDRTLLKTLSVLSVSGAVGMRTTSVGGYYCKFGRCSQVAVVVQGRGREEDE